LDISFVSEQFADVMLSSLRDFQFFDSTFGYLSYPSETGTTLLFFNAAEMKASLELEHPIENVARSPVHVTISVSPDVFFLDSKSVIRH